MKKLTKILLLILLLFATSYLLSATYAAVPHLINYQGRLTDKDGKPLDQVTRDITFRLYDSETGPGTMTPWEETHSGVVITKGIFSILIGSAKNLDLAFDKPYFLEIAVTNATGAKEVMSPRQRISSSAYSLRSETAENALQAQNAATVANIGVSTTPAANKILPLDSAAKIPQSALGLKVYDSGWFAASAGNIYTKTHNLGSTKCIIQCYASANSDGSGFVAVPGGYLDYDPYNDGSKTYIVSLSATQISLRTGGSYLYHTMDANNVTQYAVSGYLRIIILALE